MQDVDIYQKAHTLIAHYGSEDSTLNAIISTIIQLQKEDNGEEIDTWVQISDAVIELKALAAGDIVVH